MKLHEIAKRQREQEQRSQRWLARLIGCPPSTYHRFEQGGVESLKFSQLRMLLIWLDIDLRDLRDLGDLGDGDAVMRMRGAEDRHGPKGLRPMTNTELTHACKGTCSGYDAGVQEGMEKAAKICDVKNE